MMGLARGPVTLIAAGCAGLLIWLATQIDDKTTGGYWAVYGVIAVAGLVMAVSQLVGGWTKWGWPRFSPGVALFALLPVAVCVLWVTMAGQPHGNWFRDHVLNWSGDIGIGGLVHDLLEYLAVLTFGLGLVLGFTVDTKAPERAEPAGPAEPGRRLEPKTERTREPVTADGQRGRAYSRVPSR
jgi:hypothetical protein